MYEYLEQLGIKTSDYNLFAIVSGAQDHAIYTTAQKYINRSTCLFETQDEDTLRVVPQVFQLIANEPLSTWVKDHLKSYRILFFTAPNGDLFSIKNHFQPFINVLTPDYEEVYFRFYDTRTTYTYLTHCTPHELKRFFGPVDCFWLSDPKIAGLSAYHLTQENLLEEERIYTSKQNSKRILPKVFDKEPELTLNIDRVCIRPPQMEAFDHNALSDYINRLVNHLKNLSPKDFEKITNKHEYLKQGILRAKSYGFLQEKHVSKFLEIRLVLGEHFEKRAEFAWARNALIRKTNRKNRLTELYSLTKRHLKSVGSEVTL